MRQWSMHIRQKQSAHMMVAVEKEADLCWLMNWKELALTVLCFLCKHWVKVQGQLTQHLWIFILASLHNIYEYSYWTAYTTFMNIHFGEKVKLHHQYIGKGCWIVWHAYELGCAIRVPRLDLSMTIIVMRWIKPFISHFW